MQVPPNHSKLIWKWRHLLKLHSVHLYFKKCLQLFFWMSVFKFFHISRIDAYSLYFNGIQVVLVVFIVWMICINGAYCLLRNLLLQVNVTLNQSFYLKIIFLSNLKQCSAIPTMAPVFKTAPSWSALSVFHCKPHHMYFLTLFWYFL